MTRSKKLAPVVKHVEKNENSALQAVAFSQQQLQKQLAQLDQLLGYRQEYAERNHDQFTYTALQLSEYNRFLKQLDDTIEQQRRVVQTTEREVEIKRQKWQVTRSRSDAMHKMVDRINQQELQQQERADQKTMDEVALRNAIKNQ